VRQPIIAANWKLHKNRSEAEEFLNKFREKVKYVSGVEIVLGPTYTTLSTVVKGTKGTEIKVSAQNVYYELEGAYTGEISPDMLSEIGCEYVIVGHSERRHLFGETDAMINKKLHAVFNHDMLPILCIGETENERNKGQTEQVLKRQLESGLDGLDASQVANMIVAYEPVWAIGTGESASPDDAQSGCKFSRDRIGEIFDEDTCQQTRLQYGGSIKPHNAKDLMSLPDIDGGLIGGASLKPDSFAEIISITEEIYQN